MKKKSEVINMEKEILNFRDFLTTLTSVPIKIKNKELAEIFQVSDGVISKIRHGKMVSIPINMRPLSNADRFNGGNFCDLCNANIKRIQRV